MKSKRIIRVIGDIDEDSFKEFSEELSQLEGESNKPITLELCSGGGDAYAALAFHGRMIESACSMTVIVYGQASSAAVLILASGDARFMEAAAWVMVHEDSGKQVGTVVELEREAAHSRRMEVQWAHLLEVHTGTPASKWSELHKATTYLTAQECLKLGLIDKII